MDEPEEEIRFSLYRSFVEPLRFMLERLGYRFLALALHIEFVLQGLTFGGGGGGFVGAPILFLLRDYSQKGEYAMSAPRMQVLKTVALLPWSLKTLLGIVADVGVVGGYQKLPPMLFTTLLAAGASLFIAVAWPVHPVLLVGALALLFLQMACSDLLLEAKYAEHTAREPLFSKYLPSFKERITVLGQLLAILCVGPLITKLPRLADIYYLPVLPLLLTLPPLYYNWLGEQERRNKTGAPPLINCCWRIGWFQTLPSTNSSDSDSEGHTEVEEPATPLFALDCHKISESRATFTLAVAIGIICFAVSVLGLINAPSSVLCAVAIGGALAMALGFIALVDPVIAKVQCFVIAQNMFSVSLDAAVFFFYTDDASQYPEGPHFSVFFYVTVMGVVACVVAIVGTLAYDAFMTQWSYRQIYLCTNLAFVVFSLTNVIFYLRWNVAWGIPDAVFVLGAETLQIVTAIWSSLPAGAIMLSLCPPGLEATMYALLAGSSNLGGALAQYQGVFLLEMLNITPSGAANETRAFENLWVASLINSLLPLFPLILIPLLIPRGSPGKKLPDAHHPLPPPIDVSELTDMVDMSVRTDSEEEHLRTDILNRLEPWALESKENMT
jgi:hypothetical protein